VSSIRWRFSVKSILVAALGLSFACASMGSSGAPAASAEAGCTPASIAGGTIVYSRPDSTSNPIATVSANSKVCAGSDAVGFGYRRVKLPDGKEGYVADTDVI